MPILTIANAGTFEIKEGKRLVLAIEDNGIDILHRCGGFAKCMTCRVIITDGEPTTMTTAERNKLDEGDAIGKYRLSCQIPVVEDMTVEPIMTYSKLGIDVGKRPMDDITPDPEWIDRPY